MWYYISYSLCRIDKELLRLVAPFGREGGGLMDGVGRNLIFQCMPVFMYKYNLFQSITYKKTKSKREKNIAFVFIAVYYTCHPKRVLFWALEYSGRQL